MGVDVALVKQNSGVGGVGWGGNKTPPLTSPHHTSHLLHFSPALASEGVGDVLDVLDAVAGYVQGLVEMDLPGSHCPAKRSMLLSRVLLVCVVVVLRGYLHSYSCILMVLHEIDLDASKRRP